MLNLIRMNLYRFFKSKVYIGLLIVGICAAVMNLGMLDVEQSDLDYELLKEAGAEDGEKEFGIVVAPTLDPSVVYVVEGIIHSGFLLMAVSIFAVIFSAGEQTSGYLKNVILPKKKKHYLFLAKIIPISLFTILCFGITFAINMIFTSKYEVGITLAFVVSTLIQIVLHTAFAVCMLAVMEIIRNQAIGIIVAIFGSMGVHVLIMSLFESVLGGIGIPAQFMLSRYMLFTCSAALSASENGVFVSCAITAVIGLILYSILGSKVFVKRDI